MTAISIKKVDDQHINLYLFYKNFLINRKYSSSKKKIKRIDHYLWWFKKQKLRKSFYILKGNTPIFISTSDFSFFKSHKIIYSGLISCQNNSNLFDILKSIKIQNVYLDKQKSYYCFISIDKKNKVLLKHWKYFRYQPLLKKNKFYNFIKKEFNIKKNYNIYFKKIIS